MTLFESWLKTIIKKNIKLAKNAGFCYGVKRAVETTIKLKKDNPDEKISILGELIHNSHVISDLEKTGIKTLNKLEEKGEGFCVIRSHGVSEDEFNLIQSKGYEIVDLTCLDVKKAQKKAIELASEDYFVIILGKKEHPEVKAICANAKKYAKNPDNIFVGENISTIKEIEEKIKSAGKIGVVLQTTQTKEYLFEVVDYLSTISKVLRVENTICPSTALRQEEAKKLAQSCELMIVAGSKKSANTTHLAKLLSNITKTIHIEDDIELDKYKDLIKQSQNIGITAGASTPDIIINKVIEKVENIN